MAAMQIASISRRERNINTPVGAFNSTKKHSDQSRWICIYPTYLNSKKTVAEGRRVCMKFCVENPTSTEIRDVLQHAGLNCLLENHRVHPRELNKYELLYKGRVRVQIKNDDNTPIKAEYATRDLILKYLGETIPKLKGRNAQSAKVASASSTNQDQSVQSKKKKK